MKFNNIKNPIEKSITEVDLSEKELEYMSMLRLCVNLKKLKNENKFSMSVTELNKLYRKFGIPEFSSNREKHIYVLALINNFVPYEFLKHVYEKYNLNKYEKILNKIKNAPRYENEYLEEINEQITAVYEKINAALKD